MSRKYLLLFAILLVLSNLGTFFYCTVDRAAEIEGIGFGYSVLCTEIAELSSEYSRSFDQNGDWPDPGVFESSEFKYINTRFEDARGERVDEYLADVDGGTRVDVSLNQSGEIDVKVWNFMLH